MIPFIIINKKEQAKTYNFSMYNQNHDKKIYLFLSEYIRMSGKNINFNDKKIRKSDFYKNKKINNIEDIDVNNVMMLQTANWMISYLLKT